MNELNGYLAVLGGWPALHPVIQFGKHARFCVACAGEAKGSGTWNGQIKTAIEDEGPPAGNPDERNGIVSRELGVPSRRASLERSGSSSSCPRGGVADLLIRHLLRLGRGEAFTDVVSHRALSQTRKPRIGGCAKDREGDRVPF